MKATTKMGLGAAILAASAVTATQTPDSTDQAYVAGYYTGRLIILLAGLGLLVAGLVQWLRQRKK